MQLETPRLLIREFVADDAAAVQAYAGDPEAVRYMAFPPSTPEVTRDFIARCQALAAEQPRRWYDMGIVLAATGELIGGIALDVYDRAHGQGAFAYILRRSAWGQGYATEALEAMLRFGFEQLGLQRIGDDCDVANVGSARVMEKCGLRYEGEWDDVRHYALTAAEWRARCRS